MAVRCAHQVKPPVRMAHPDRLQNRVDRASSIHPLLPHRGPAHVEIAISQPLEPPFHLLFVNPWLWGAIALSLALQLAVVHVPLMNAAFGTSPLSWDQWMVCAAMGSIVLWAAEARKWLLRNIFGQA